jgi:hypothetical protein
MDDDPLDHQLQNGLSFRDAGGLQPGSDSVTEGCQARQCLLSLNTLLPQAPMLLKLLFG